MTEIALGAVGLLVLGIGALVRWPLLVGLGLALGGLGYAAGLHDVHGTARTISAVLVAAGLLVGGELGFGLVSRSGAGARRRPGAARELALSLLTCGVGAAAVAVLVLAATSLSLARSVAVTALGTVAAVVAVGLLVAVVRRLAEPPV